MTHKSYRRHQRSMRLRGHDHAQMGAYFITIVTQARVCLFWRDCGWRNEVEWCRTNGAGVVDRIRKEISKCNAKTKWWMVGRLSHKRSAGRLEYGRPALFSERHKCLSSRERWAAGDRSLHSDLTWDVTR